MDWIIIIVLVIVIIGLYGHKLSIEKLAERIDDLEKK